jgi:hypothetical protein
MLKQTPKVKIGPLTRWQREWQMLEIFHILKYPCLLGSLLNGFDKNAHSG